LVHEERRTTQKKEEVKSVSKCQTGDASEKTKQENGDETYSGKTFLHQRMDQNTLVSIPQHRELTKG